jgi:hypothetical protein
MALNAVRLALEREGHGQMIQRVLPYPVDQVLGGVEVRRIARGMQVLHDHSARVRDFRQQLGQGRLHALAMDAAVVEDQQQVAVSQPGVAQNQEGDRENRVLGFAAGTEVGMRHATRQVYGEEAVDFLAVPFIARHLWSGVLLRPGVPRIRDGLEGELIQAQYRRRWR